MDTEIQKKFESLPQDVQDAISSPTVLEKVRGLAIKHNLHIDQSGIFEEAVTRVMLGIEHAEDFVENLENRLNITTDEAIELATEVNIEIFLPIKSSLMKMQATKTQPVPQPIPTTPSNPTRADILAEIENPTPVQHPISSVPQTPSATAHEFIAVKMTEPASMPPQKYTADPYREPLS